jgi:hypothetical protein
VPYTACQTRTYTHTHAQTHNHKAILMGVLHLLQGGRQCGPNPATLGSHQPTLARNPHPSLLSHTHTHFFPHTSLTLVTLPRHTSHHTSPSASPVKHTVASSGCHATARTSAVWPDSTCTRHTHTHIHTHIHTHTLMNTHIHTWTTSAGKSCEWLRPRPSLGPPLVGKQLRTRVLNPAEPPTPSRPLLGKI